jgi:plasmid stabilization system protein ParE
LQPVELRRQPLRKTTLARPYVIRYRVEPNRVVILRVRHSARRRTRP